jgi:glycine hydroxymethyltransferase
MCVFPIEGLPGERFFPGTGTMDIIEQLSENLLQSLFSIKGDYRATIQPHSGTQANQIVFNALLGHDDTVLCLRPQDGGHISHKVLVGRRNKAHFYGLTSESLINYDELRRLALHLRPKLVIAGGSSYPREIDFARIAAISHEAGAFLHADISHTATFVAAGVHRSVFPHADFVTFNMVKNLRGPNGGVLIYRQVHHAGIKRAIFPGTQGGPNENTMFGKLVALDQLTRFDLHAYALRMVKLSTLISDVLRARNVSVVTSGSDSHIVLIDLRESKSTGAEVEQRCEKGRVLLNRNLVPNDLRQPWITSGLRIGTACLAILEYSNAHVIKLANWVADRIHNKDDDSVMALPAELTAIYNQKLTSLRFVGATTNQ